MLHVLIVSATQEQRGEREVVPWDREVHMPTSRVVHFFSDGLKLEADLHLPDGAKADARLMRNRVIAMEQVVDIRAALTCLGLQHEVDPKRLGIWGTSGGGAHAPYVAGIDDRVKAAVGQVGYGDGWRLIMDHKTPEQRAQLLADLEEDRKQRAQAGKSREVFTIDVLSNPATRNFVLEYAKTDPSIKTKLALESAEATLYYRPIDAVDRISPRALLLIGAEKDDLCLIDGYKEMFDRAKEPKKWISYPIGHYEIYIPDTWGKRSADDAIAWYREYL
jgi:hypothetical protein